MKIVVEVKKPRNPFVVLAKKMKAGSHTKSGKATRRKEKMEMVKYGVVIQWQNIRLLTDQQEFDSLQPYHHIKVYF